MGQMLPPSFAICSRSSPNEHVDAQHASCRTSLGTNTEARHGGWRPTSKRRHKDGVTQNDATDEAHNGCPSLAEAAGIGT